MERLQLIRILLVADDPALARWLARVLEDAERGPMELAGAVGLGEQVSAVAARTCPDLIMVDIEAGGNAAIVRLSAQCEAPIVALAAECDAPARARAVRAGASGVVLKRDAPATLRKAFRTVKNSELWLDRVATAQLVKDLIGGGGVPRAIASTHIGPIANLTPRESDIVRALLSHSGASSRVLAAQLGISEQTLRNHFSSIYRKLRIPNRVGLVAYAARHCFDNAA